QSDHVQPHRIAQRRRLKIQVPQEQVPAPRLQGEKDGIERQREEEGPPRQTAEVDEQPLEIGDQQEIGEERRADQAREPAPNAQLSGPLNRRLAICSEIRPNRKSTIPPRKNITVEGGRCSQIPSSATDQP